MINHAKKAHALIKRTGYASGGSIGQFSSEVNRYLNTPNNQEDTEEEPNAPPLYLHQTFGDGRTPSVTSTSWDPEVGTKPNKGGGKPSANKNETWSSRANEVKNALGMKRGGKRK